jgi:hypothetical protein
MNATELYKEAVILRDLPEARLHAGDVGTVVEILKHPADGPRGVMLEVFNVLGDTIAVVTLPETEVEPLADDEVWHARRLSRAS